MSNSAAGLLLALALLPATPAPIPAPAQVRRVAVTIDDGPVVGELKDLQRFQRISAGLIGALQAQRVPATIFVNERQLNVPGQRDARAAVLEQWLDAGFELGNHTYSHLSANEVSLARFGDDVVKGEVIMRPLVEAHGRKLVWFRYPYLHSGTSPDGHDGIVAFLSERGYRVAPITVDYADYTFAGIYTGQLLRGDAEAAARVKQAYLEQVDVGFEYAEKASVEVFGYEVPQILLIHCNELNSVSLMDTIARLRQRGYAFITLDEAMSDPAYQRADSFTGPGGSWLSRSARAAGKQISAPQPRVPDWVVQLAPPRTSGSKIE